MTFSANHDIGRKNMNIQRYIGATKSAIFSGIVIPIIFGIISPIKSIIRVVHIGSTIRIVSCE